MLPWKQTEYKSLRQVFIAGPISFNKEEKYVGIWIILTKLLVLDFGKHQIIQYVEKGHINEKTR